MPVCLSCDLRFQPGAHHRHMPGSRAVVPLPADPVRCRCIDAGEPGELDKWRWWLAQARVAVAGVEGVP